MIPFDQTWPYETIQDDVYLTSCPFCPAENVLIPLQPQEFESIHLGQKRLVVFPCCRNKITLIDVDQDYLLSDRPLRPKRKKS